MKRALVGLVIVAIALPATLFAQPSPEPVPAPTPTEPGGPTGGGTTPAGPAQPAPSQPQGPQQTPPPSGGGVSWQGRPIERVQFRGNRKVEDDAIRVQLLSKPGTLLDATKLREDLRAMWKMGFFADIDVEGEVGPSGALTLTFAVKEKPAIRKVLIAGNAEMGLDKINEVLDLELDAIVDISKVKKNRDKIADLYVQKGFYLATVDYEIKPVNEAEVDVWFKIDEKAKVKIREVQFIGNNNISDDELRGSIATRRADALSFLNDSGTYSQEAFERDLLLVSAHYWDKGYANVKVGTPQLRLSRDKQYMYLSIPIDEGPIFTIGAVNFKGDLIGGAPKNLEKVKVRPGMTFSRTKIAEDRENLSAFYQDQGYAYANVLPLTKVDLDKKQISLTFEVSRGKRAYFERINIRGNSKTRDKVIRREMKISEGELFNNTNLEVSKRRVMALGFFENVVVSTKRGSSDEFVEVNVEVTERPTGTFQIGAGFSSVENFIAQAQISQNNLFGRGQTLALQAQISSLRQLFLLRFVEPYFLDTQWTFAFDLYNQSRGFGSFYRNASGGTLTWGYALTPFFDFGSTIRDVRAFLTYKLENVSITQGSGGVTTLGATTLPTQANTVANLFRGGITSSVRASISWDSRNNRLFPTGGFYHSLFAEYASQYTGSENKFIRWGGFARHYRPLWGPFVLKLNAEIGVTTSTDPLGVPISERYLVGGIYNIRGYAPLSLGPRLLTQQAGDPNQNLTPGGIPLGGNMQLIWNSEIEFPLFKKVGISGVVFYDMGNAYNLESRYCSGLQRKNSSVPIQFDPCFRFPESLTAGIRKSVGFGFRWISPIGPLRFEWGIPLDAQPGEDPLVFEFTIGNFF
ncbi:MAG: outer membrane protein assembly factor BamA [Kofleriaceae bacterium]|nr:outer membrane protein assembly factor BamA [Kofleriaceae bacterium]